MDIKLIFFAIFLLLVGLSFFGLNKLIQKLAYDKSQRYLHCRIIPALFLVLLGATNVYTISPMLNVIDKIINAPFLQGLFTAIMPNRAYELLYMLLMLIGLNFAVALIVIITILLVKLIFIRCKRFIDIDEYDGFHRLLHLPWLVTKYFYEEGDDSARLNGRGFTMGIWAKGFKRSFAILWFLEMSTIAISIIWGSEAWNKELLAITKAWYMLPMAGFFLIEQIQFYLESQSDEQAGTFGSAKIEESQSGDMLVLLKGYRHVFGRSGAIVLSDINQSAENRVSNGLVSNTLGNRQIEDCKQPDVLNVISNQLKQCGAPQSEQYQNALIELLNGHSINICDHCEGEFLPILAAYLNFYMSQGKTALMLCKDYKRAEELCDALNAEMKRLNSLYSVWNVSTLEGAEVNQRMSMLVCSYDDFLDHHITGKRRDFIGDLFCTVIADGFELFSKDSIRIERLFGELRELDNMERYVLFTGVDNDALRTAMEQTVKEEILPFHNDPIYPNTGIMVWREESFYKLQQHLGIGNALSPYMGVAIPIALMAAKYDLPHMFLMRDSSRGDLSYNDVLAMCTKEVDCYVAKNVNLKSVIRHKLSEVLEQRELSMIIAYDTDYNFYNALWRWMKYGGLHGTLIHVISPSYLLREYFAANYKDQRMLMKNNEFDAFISYHLGMKISHMAVLMVAMANGGLTEDELMEKNKEYSWNYDNVQSLLEDCLSVVFTNQEIHNIYECFHFEDEKHFREDIGKFEVKSRITIIDDEIRTRLKEQIGYASLISKDDQGKLLPILNGNLLNYYLREQVVPFDGHFHQINAIVGGSVYAEQTLPVDLPEYYQLSDFVFENFKQVDQCVDYGYMDLNICTAAVTRRIYGYLSSNRGNEFGANCNLQVSDIRDENGNGISDRFGCANLLEIKVKRNIFGDKSVEATRLFAYMLKELFKTLFPMTHQNLYTVVSEGVDADLLPRILSNGKDSSINDLVCSLIPRLATKMPTDNEFITLYVVELSCIEYGMVRMLYTKYQNVMLMIREYLTWYMRSATTDSEATDDIRTEIRGKYLNFGTDSIPEVFCPEALLALCRKVLPETEEIIEATTTETIDAESKICTFCGRPSMFPVVLDDGRCMCGHCKEHQLTQKDEIKSLFMETVDFMNDGYSIELPKNIHVRFQSADAIRKETGDTEGGRVLGFYSPGNHQLWIEARGPRIAMQSTLIHELTHVWHHSDKTFCDAFAKMLRKFPRNKRAWVRLLLLEGHAVFMEIETMRRMNEDAYAKYLHDMTMEREDEYGAGYRLIYGYMLDRAQEGSHMTPFQAMIQLVLDILEGKVTIQ